MAVTVSAGSAKLAVGRRDASPTRLVQRQNLRSALDASGLPRLLRSSRWTLEQPLALGRLDPGQPGMLLR
jgi:hypothetical protein